MIGDEERDEIALYEYPSIQAFIEMVQDKDYQEIMKFRAEAIIDHGNHPIGVGDKIFGLFLISRMKQHFVHDPW